MPLVTASLILGLLGRQAEELAALREELHILRHPFLGDSPAAWDTPDDRPW